MPLFTRSRIYQVNEKTLFELLVVDSLKEFGVSNLNRQDLRGLKTVKKYQSKGEDVETTLQINEYIKNERYIIETRLKDIIYVVDVKVEIVGENETKLSYTEVIKSTKWYKKFSLSLFAILSKSKFLLKINGILDQVEMKIKNDKLEDNKID